MKAAPPLARASASSRHFTLAFAAVVAGVLLTMGIVNALVDPYNILGQNRIGVYASNERLAKPMLLQRGGYDVIIIGSSKVASIDPTDLAGGRAFNASFGAALPEEMAWFLDSFARPGQLVVVGLDFYMFNEREFLRVDKDPFADTNRPSRIAYVFGWDVLSMSVRSLVARYWKGDPPAILREGTRNQAPDWTRHNALTEPDYDRVFTTLRNHHYRAVKYSERRVALLSKLKARLEQKNVRLITFINPLHHGVRDIIRELAEADFQRFRRDMKTIFPEIYDLTGDEFSDRDLYFRHDPYHYKPAVGACLINQMIAGRRAIKPPMTPEQC